MLLYSIKRTDTGEKFNGWRWDEKPYWNDIGALYRDIDTIVRHLKWLCSDEKWENVTENRWGASRKCILWNRYEPSYNKARLSLYEVLIHDVTLKGSRQISAKEFFNDQD